MTESEICRTSYEWEGSSPSVYFRPMNPALSAQHFFPSDSPVMVEDKFRQSYRGGLMLTPASPLFGSTSYMSQDSSCCSVLNNAVIMDDDDNETIPTDERPILVPINAALVDDVSPIVEKSFNVSDLVPLQSSTVVSSSSFPNPSGLSEDRNNSSLQEFLHHNQAPVAPLDVAFLANSPGPQWSPGIRGATQKTPNPSVIRIESTLNFLDEIPSASPKRKCLPNHQDSSSISLSAILLPGSSQIGDATADKAASPVRRLTHQRSGALPYVFPRDEPQEAPIQPPPIQNKFIYSNPASRKTVLTSEERELRDAEEGRRRLLAQIRMNRNNFRILASEVKNPVSSSFLRNRDSSFSSRIRSSSNQAAAPTIRGAVRVKLSTPPANTSSFMIGGPRSSSSSFINRSRFEHTPSRISAIPRSTMGIYAARRAPTLPPVRPAWR